MSITYDLTSSLIYGHYIQIEGKGTLTTHSLQTSWDVTTDGGFRFVGNPSQIEVEMFLWGSGLHLYIDGVDQGLITTATGSVYGFATIATGLDTAVNHTYEICGAKGNVFIFKTLRTPGSDLVTTDLAARPVLAGYGDSITAGQSKADADSCTSWLKKAGVALNYQVVNYGFPSTGVVVGAANSGQNRTAKITSLNPKADICVVLYGINDATASGDQPTFSTACDSMFAALASGTTTTRFIVEKILKHGASTTDQDPYSALEAASIATLANSRVVYKTGMYDAYNGVSGLHPALTDQAALVTAVLADVALPVVASSGIRGLGGLINRR